MRNSACTHALLLLVLPCLAAPAGAEEAVPSCFSNPTCQLVFQQAREQSGQRRLEEAVKLYKTAYELSSDPVLLFNIARVLHKQGQSPEAAAYYRKYLNSPVDNAEQKGKAQEYLLQLSSTMDAAPSAPPVPARAEAPEPPTLPTQDRTDKTGRAIVGSAPVLLASGAEPRRDEGKASQPLSKKWWLWTLVSGAAAAGAVGLGIGLAGSLGATSQPQGLNVYQPSF